MQKKTMIKDFQILNKEKISITDFFSLPQTPVWFILPLVSGRRHLEEPCLVTWILCQIDSSWALIPVATQIFGKLKNIMPANIYQALIMC